MSADGAGGTTTDLRNGSWRMRKCRGKQNKWFSILLPLQQVSFSHAEEHSWCDEWVCTGAVLFCPVLATLRKHRFHLFLTRRWYVGTVSVTSVTTDINPRQKPLNQKAFNTL